MMILREAARLPYGLGDVELVAPVPLTYMVTKSALADNDVLMNVPSGVRFVITYVYLLARNTAITNGTNLGINCYTDVGVVYPAAIDTVPGVAAAYNQVFYPNLLMSPGSRIQASVPAAYADNNITFGGYFVPQ